MNIKNFLMAIICFCTAFCILSIFSGCNSENDNLEQTDTNFEENISEVDFESDTSGGNWMHTFVDSTIEDGSVVYRTAIGKPNDSDYVTSFFIYCFKDGVKQWVYRTSVFYGGQFPNGTELMAFDDENVYISIDRSHLHSEGIRTSTIAIDKNTGEDVWCVNNTGYACILLDNENVYVTGYDGHGLYIISKDGVLKAENIGASGNMVFVDEDVIAIFPESGRIDVDISAYKSKDTIPDKITKSLPIKVSASSTLPSDASKDYEAKNLTDKDPSTVWCEGEDGLGEGTVLNVDLGETKVIGNIFIRNGHNGSRELYEKNGKSVELEIDFNNGSEPRRVTCNNIYDSWESIDTYDAVGPIECSSITIKIIKAEAGTKYSDVCISEIEVYEATASLY